MVRSRPGERRVGHNHRERLEAALVEALEVDRRADRSHRVVARLAGRNRLGVARLVDRNRLGVDSNRLEP